MIRIIAMEREYGAGGSAIAQKLAEHLKWKLWDTALTAEIARMARCDQSSVAQMEERVDPLFYRLMKVFMRGSYERSLPVNGLEHLDADSMVVFMKRVVEGAAAAGNCVILGRGAPYVLRERRDTLHVFVYAPLEEKIRRVRDLGKTDAEAVELVGAIDQERATFVKKYFGKEWPSRHLYHLMINSAVGDEVVVRTILDEMETLNGTRAAATPG
ncbi:MAG: cytidylate kinase-like family protein [Bryobacteraceae bacterium]|jgi:cytidylate kinase